MIVDSHTHVAASDRKRYPLNPRGRGSRWFTADDVNAADLLAVMKREGVDRAVVVQGIGAYGFDCRYAIAAAQASPGELCLVGAIDMASDDPVGALAHLVAAGGASLRGLRQFGVETSPPDWLVDGRADAVWSAAVNYGLTPVLTLMPDSLPQLSELLDRHPELPVIVEHIGFIDLTGGPPFARGAALFELARHPSVNVKVTTHSLAAAEAIGDPADLIDHLVHVFGAGRLVWGSDYPQSPGRSYAQMLDLARHATRRLRDADRDQFFGGTALRLWWGATTAVASAEVCA